MYSGFGGTIRPGRLLSSAIVGLVPQIDLGGRRLAFERLGEGSPLLFLNGSGSSIERSRLLWESFGSVADVVAHDYRGIGASDRGETPTMHGFATDALALADNLGWSTFDVVGVSFGGMVALELACSAPDRVRRLVLMCTSAGGPLGSSFPLHELLDVAIDEKRRRMPLLTDTRFTPDYLSERPALRSLIEQSIEDRPVTAGDREQMAARRLHDVSSRLGGVTAQTLVMSGIHDGIAPVANGRNIAGAIDGSMFREYEGGHMFFVQDTRALDEAKRFLVGGPATLDG